MPSPDQSQYNTLTLFDKSAYELIQQALADAQFKLPGYNPKVGTYEMVTQETTALMISELIYAVNRLPDAIMEIQMQNFGIARDLGTPPSVDVLITVVDTVGYTIPAGVQFRLEDGSGNQIIFVTDVAATVTPSATTTTVNATATVNTDQWNGTVSGTSLALISPISFIQNAETASVASGGASPETDDEWRTRGVELFQSLSAVLVLPDQFTAKALTISGVDRAYTKDDWNVDTAATGHVTIAVTDSAGAALSGDDKTEISEQLDSQAMAALEIHVVDPDYNPVDIAVTAVAQSGYVVSDVQSSIQDALEAYLSPATWGWGDTLYVNELISLIDHVTGVERVTSVEICEHGGSLASTDLVLTGDFPLVSVDDPSTDITVSVTAG